MKIKINLSTATTIATLNPEDEFHFVQHNQTHLKGRKFKYSHRTGKYCYYLEPNSEKLLDCFWNQQVIKV